MDKKTSDDDYKDNIVHTLPLPLLLMNLHQDENAIVNFYIRIMI